MHRTIPVFIPMLACPNQCIYCNQHVISGQLRMPSDEEIVATIETHLSTMAVGCVVELGFFGGTFTGLPLGQQERMLRLVQPYLDKGRIVSVRLSTRPDYISGEGVAMLKLYGVATVELGVQSLDDEVLAASERGYTAQQVYEAADIIRQQGLEVGMQMMVGLPADTPEKTLYTARQIVVHSAGNTRVYPTLVIPGTELSRRYHQGLYQPLTVDEAVRWTAPVLRLFEEHGVTVLRVGLHPTEGFIGGKDYEAGPFHVAFKQLVETEIFRQQFQDTTLPKGDGEVTVYVAPSKRQSAIGYGASNRRMMQQRVGERRVRFVADASLHGYAFRVE